MAQLEPAGQTELGHVSLEVGAIFRVVELSDDELDQITELRRLLEVPTVRGLAGNLDASRIKDLRKRAEEIGRHARAGDVVAYVEADRDLHLALLSAAGNQRLVELVGRLRDQSRLYGLEQLAADGVLAESADEHLDLLDALERGDAEAAEAFISHHLDHVRGIWAQRRESRG